MPSRWDRFKAFFLEDREQRSLTVNDAIKGLWAGRTTSTGLLVDEKSSLQVITVFNAVKILAEGFAQIPFKVYRKDGEGRVELRDHPIYGLLHDAPNERMTAFAMREHWMTSLALWGNSYTEIIRNNRGEVVELWPLHPQYTNPVRLPDGRVAYRTTINADPTGYAPSTENIVLREDQVLHIRGLSLDGFKGLSIIEQIRENVALADAYTQFAARFFDADATDFALSTERVMQQPQLDEMHREWTEKHGGLRNRHNLAIFHGGLKPIPLGMPLDDAQFIEQRQFAREEIMSFYRIPPNFYAADKVSSWGTGIEQMSIGFIKFTMDPWFVRAEQAVNLKFLSQNAQGPIFSEFDREGFLRGDFATRIQGYKDLFAMGTISNKKIAQIENLPEPPVEVYLVPSNMVPAEKIGAIADKQATPTPVAQPAATSDNATARLSLMRAYRPVFLDVVDRILRRAAFDITQAKEKKSGDDLEKWLAEFRTDHQGFALKHLRSAVEGFADAICGDVSRETGLRVVAFPNYLQMSLEALAARIAVSSDAESTVDSELVPLGNMIAEMAYRQAGTTFEAIDRGEHKILVSRVTEERPNGPSIVVVQQPQPTLMRSVSASTGGEEMKADEMRAIMQEFAAQIRDSLRPQEPPILRIEPGAITVNVAPPNLTIERGAVEAPINVQPPASAGIDIAYDSQGRMVGTRPRSLTGN